MTHNNKTVTATRSTWFFNAWRYTDGTSSIQHKRLPASRLKQLNEILNLATLDQTVIDPRDLMYRLSHDSIGGLKFLREKTGMGLAECRDYLLKFDLWSPQWPRWTHRPFGEI